MADEKERLEQVNQLAIKMTSLVDDGEALEGSISFKAFMELCNNLKQICQMQMDNLSSSKEEEEIIEMQKEHYEMVMEDINLLLQDIDYAPFEESEKPKMFAMELQAIATQLMDAPAPPKDEDEEEEEAE